MGFVRRNDLRSGPKTRCEMDGGRRIARFRYGGFGGCAPASIPRPWPCARWRLESDQASRKSGASLIFLSMISGKRARVGSQAKTRFPLFPDHASNIISCQRITCPRTPAIGASLRKETGFDFHTIDGEALLGTSAPIMHSRLGRDRTPRSRNRQVEIDAMCLELVGPRDRRRNIICAG